MKHGVHLFVRLTCHFYKQVYATFHFLIISELVCGNPYLKSHEEDNKPSPIEIGSKMKISIIDCCTFFISGTYTSNIPNFQLSEVRCFCTTRLRLVLKTSPSLEIAYFLILYNILFLQLSYTQKTILLYQQESACRRRFSAKNRTKTISSYGSYRIILQQEVTTPIAG